MIYAVSLDLTTMLSLTDMIDLLLEAVLQYLSASGKLPSSAAPITIL